MIPEGFRLLHTGRDRGDLILRLEDAAHPDETDWNRIRLSARDLITDPHELADWLREDRRSIDVTDATIGRALEVVRALAADLLKRGHCIGISRRGKTTRPPRARAWAPVRAERQGGTRPRPARIHRRGTPEPKTLHLATGHARVRRGPFGPAQARAGGRAWSAVLGG
ncbi:hypothetical protein HD596_000815 [Nonomuraea jabiensis]|uniref:Uncharacterized protein n=1 Tax=Nonomuraea jabiensis TaxID=882448 RepID=A0A7W9L831_9ACTN|nr:hypothetical protein [Nonomuraea jabiensis]